MAQAVMARGWRRDVAGRAAPIVGRARYRRRSLAVAAGARRRAG